MTAFRTLPLILAVAAMVGSAMVNAQARGTLQRPSQTRGATVEESSQVLDDATRHRKMAELEAWLQRLEGGFHVDAELRSLSGTTRTEGTAVCSRVGDGPAVRCVIQGIHRDVNERDRGTLPLLYLAVEPEGLKIQLLLVDKQQAAASTGALAANAVELQDNWKVCHKTWTSCWAVARIAAPPDREIAIALSEDHWAQGRKALTMTYLLRLTRDGTVQLQVPRTAD